MRFINTNHKNKDQKGDGYPLNVKIKEEYFEMNGYYIYFAIQSAFYG
jgi:hypothetical protein